MRSGDREGEGTEVMLFWVKNCWTLSTVWTDTLINHPSWNGQMHWKGLQNKFHWSWMQPLTTRPAGTLIQMGSWNTHLVGGSMNYKGLAHLPEDNSRLLWGPPYIIIQLSQNLLAWQDILWFFSVLYLFWAQTDSSSVPRGVDWAHSCGCIQLGAQLETPKWLHSCVWQCGWNSWGLAGSLFFPHSSAVWPKILYKAASSQRAKQKLLGPFGQSSEVQKVTSTAFCWSKQIPKLGQVQREGNRFFLLMHTSSHKDREELFGGKYWWASLKIHIYQKHYL